MDLLNHILALIPTTGAPAVATAAIIVEVLLRLISMFIPGDKVLSILHLAAKACNVAGQILSKVGALLDAVTPSLIK